MCKTQHVAFRTKVDQTTHQIACLLKNEGKESTYIGSGHLPQEAYQTAAFVKNMDALFDIFNSTGLHDVKLYKRALQKIVPRLSTCT